MAEAVGARGKGDTAAREGTVNAKTKCTRLCENCIENGETPPSPCGFPGEEPHVAHQCVECAWKQPARDQPQPEPEAETQEVTGVREQGDEETRGVRPTEETPPRTPEERPEAKPEEEKRTQDPEVEEKGEPEGWCQADASDDVVHAAAVNEAEQTDKPPRAEDTRTGRRGTTEGRKTWRW